MRFRSPLVTREDVVRLVGVLTEHWRGRTLRDLARRHRIRASVVETAARLGMVSIVVRRPATGRPSRSAVLRTRDEVNKILSAKAEDDFPSLRAWEALPYRCQTPASLSLREVRFLNHYWGRRGSSGRIGQRGSHSAADAYQVAYGGRRKLKWGTAKSSGARLARTPWIRAARLLLLRCATPDSPLDLPDDMRSAGEDWLAFALELDAVFQCSWPTDVVEAIRRSPTYSIALLKLGALNRFREVV